MTFGLAAQVLITGAGPSDPKEAAVWRLTGKQPYSVRVGDTWYAMHRLGPLAMIMGVAADAYEFGENMETQDASKLGGLLVASITKGLLNESFMRGPADLIQALEDPDRYGARYVQSQLATLMPFSTGMAQVARAADPYAREARTIVDTLISRTPWLSETLLPRRDIWGQPMPNKDDFGGAGISAIAEAKINQDPVNVALWQAQAFPAPLERKIRNVPLTDQQFDDYARVAGTMAKMRLDAMVAMPVFGALPIGAQKRVMLETIDHSRELARSLILMQNPSIVQAALAAKQAQITGTRP
jgi:hypothetical protein